MLPRYGFVRKSVSRFMPGEQIGDALDAAERLKQSGIPTVATHLGENVGDAGETHKVRDHYLEVLPQIQARGLDTHISVKLTELGLDQDPDLCAANIKSLLDKAASAGTFVWIDIEGTKYTSATLELFQRVRSEHPGVGLCLQAYLRRTAADLEKLLPLAPVIRLVKGAYAEPPDLAFPKKSDTDENFFSIAKKLLEQAKTRGVVPGFATHDVGLIRRIAKEAETMGVARDAYEVQMLYGIRSEAQLQLVREGFRVRVLISYGTFWFPWYMRRLAERPANVWFVLRNITAK
jgi:proline dehydrogenase